MTEDVPVRREKSDTKALPRGTLGIKINGQRIQLGLNGGILTSLLGLLLMAWTWGSTTYEDIQESKDSLIALTRATQAIESQLGSALETTALNAGAIEVLKIKTAELEAENTELQTANGEQGDKIKVLEECHEHPKRCKL